MKKLWAASAAGVMLIALSSCSQPGTSAPVPQATPGMSFDNGLLTIQSEQPPNGNSSSGEARLAGALSFEDECVRVGGVAIVVPSPASWDGEALTVGDQTFALGDELEMAGSYATERLPGQPTDCPGETFFTNAVEPLESKR